MSPLAGLKLIDPLGQRGDHLGQLLHQASETDGAVMVAFRWKAVWGGGGQVRHGVQCRGNSTVSPLNSHNSR